MSVPMLERDARAGQGFGEPVGQCCVAERAAGVLPAGHYWLTTEESVLLKHYAARGPEFCASLLPGRTLRAVYAKAAAMGLKTSNPAAFKPGNVRRTRWETSDVIDQRIRDAYAAARRKGDLKRLAVELQRPESWVQARAAKLGVARSNRARCDGWSAQELALLEQCAHLEVKTIARKLRQAGYERTPIAIGVKLKRMRFDRTDPDAWTAPDLAGLLGVSAATVNYWIERRALPAERQDWGPNGRHVIRRGPLRAWLKDHPAHVDLRRVDSVWFLELVLGAPR